MPYKDKEKHNEYHREYSRKWRKENQDKKQEENRRYRESKLNHCVYLLELTDCRMYVGSTSWLTERLGVHRQHSLYSPNRKLYKAIKELGGWDQVKVHVLMKDIPFEDLRLRLEQHFIDMVPEELRLNQADVVV